MEEIRKQLKTLEQEVSALKQKRIGRGDVMPLEIKQTHIDGLIIFRGLSTDRPLDGSTEIQAYYSEDISTMSIWNTVTELWESEVFT